MNDVVLGIDLGTSNSVVSVMLENESIVIPDDRGNRIHPSIVYFFEDGQTVVGNDAMPYMLKDPSHTVYSAKRLIGRPFDSPDLRVLIGSFPFKIIASGDGAPRISMYGSMHAPESISARVLLYLKQLAEKYLGMPIGKAVITVPANFDEGQRRATKRAGELAGLDVLRLINEPTAAALAYGHGSSKREKVAIYDFGGGTFDITILELRQNVYQVLSTAGNSYLGGDDFDNRLVQSMLTAFEKQYGYDLAGEDAIIQRLKSVAQTIKHRLSDQDLVTARVSEMVPGTLTELELEFSLTRDAFNKRCSDIVETSLATCEEAMQLAGLQRAELDHLVLVGGTTRVPLVQRRVREFFGREPVHGVNPDEVVSVGAAIFGASILEPVDAPTSNFAPPSVSADYAEHLEDESWLEELEDDEPTSRQSIGQPVGYEPPHSPPSLPSHHAAPHASPQYHQAPPQYPQAPQRQAAPLLIDVTPHALGIATVGGVMDIIIERNGSLPLARTRLFSTSRDNQTRVVLPIYSGNSRRIEENRQLGSLEMVDIPPGPREECQIEVAFEVDTNGMLSVRATDMRTGQNTAARISILGEAQGNYYDASNLLMG
ncbi:MAG: Hsp70 family protein [bacterium]